VNGDFLYTQEQRGDDEIVAAYRVSTGVPVWKHRDAARFWESNGGAGPRATPTFSGGRLYAFGATGILNALDAADGRVVWSRNVGADSHTKVPDWGSRPRRSSSGPDRRRRLRTVATRPPRRPTLSGDAARRSHVSLTIHISPDFSWTRGATSVARPTARGLELTDL
jgi:hypothetical protein